MRIAIALALLLVAGCGGSDYAGLDRGDAESRLERAVEEARADGTIARSLSAALGDPGDEAMARAGAAELSALALSRKPSIEPGVGPDGGDAWVGAYAIAGIGSAAVVCAYAWEDLAVVEVAATC